jgi:hydrogenase maturation protease
MVVIGYGNTLRGDDGAGWAAAELLMRRRPDLDVHAVQTLVPELVSTLAATRVAVFVDVRRGERPGRVGIELIDRDGDAGASHGFSPAALVGYAERLFGRRPVAFLVTVEGTQFAFGNTLSPDVEHAIPEVVAAIEWLERSARSPARATATGHSSFSRISSDSTVLTTLTTSAPNTAAQKPLT